MSFDVNVGRPEPMIKASAGMNNDGGSGGNTGYMMRGRKKKRDDYGSLFSSDNDERDSFQFSSGSHNNPYAPQEKESWISKLMKKL